MVIQERTGPAPLYTLARGAAEAAAAGSYLAGADIGDRERVRRHMNRRLSGLCQEITLTAAFRSPEAQAKVTHLEEKVAAIGRTARQHGFAFRPRDRRGAAYIGDRPPSVTALIDGCASRTPSMGATYYRLLSSVAHSQPHGLARFVIPDEGGRAALSSTAQDLALNLLAGPLCTATLIEHLAWYPGWDCDGIRPLVIRTLHAWGRIGGVPYSGPEAAPSAVRPENPNGDR